MPGTKSAPRWVGFDMDECLGSFLSLWPFCELVPQSMSWTNQQTDQYLTDIAKQLAQNQTLWVFRPGLTPLFRALAKAHSAGRIEGCFLLTNNASWNLMEVVRRTLNIRVLGLATATSGTPRELFRIGWTRESPCRRKSASGSKLAKDFACVQGCLQSAQLPPLLAVSDLLFYDDLATHELANQIPHYVTVPAYTYYTPVSLVFRDLKPILQRHGIPGAVMERITRQAYTYEEEDLKTDKTLLAYSPSKASVDMDPFLLGLQQFLKSSRFPTRKHKTARRSGNGIGRLTPATPTRRQNRRANVIRRVVYRRH